MKKGSFVRLSDLGKENLISNGCKEHVDEFGDCIGIVEGNFLEIYPELDVRWQPSQLRYAYAPECLIEVHLGDTN